MSKARLVADPSVGVGDLEGVLKKFFEDVVGDGKVDFLDYCLHPPGLTWKSSCSPGWLVKLAPLLKLYLQVARNGVLPTKRHKSALESVATARNLLEKSKKSMADWVDITDDSIRMALSHLRNLFASSEAKCRAFRRMDRRQQDTVQGLLDLLDMGGVRPADIEEEVPAGSLVPFKEPSSSSKAVDRQNSVSSFGSLDSFSSQQDDVDPGKIFARILAQHDSVESQKSYGSVAAPSKFLVGTPSPEKGFLPGLLQEAGMESELSESDQKILLACKDQEPPSKPKPKSKNKKAVASKAKQDKKGDDSKATAKQDKKDDDSKAMSVRTPALPDDQVDRTTLRKRTVSRAYHRTEDKFMALGKGKEFAQKRARKDAAAAGQEFDRQHPKPTKKNPKKSPGGTIPKENPDGTIPEESPDGTIPNKTADGTMPKSRKQAAKLVFFLDFS